MNSEPVKRLIPLLLSITLPVSMCLPVLGQGCGSSLFSEAGQAKYLQFQFACAISYLTVLFLKTSLLTWYFHKSGFAKITLRSILGTLLALSLPCIGSFYALSLLLTFFSNPLVAVGVFAVGIALWGTICDYLFATNWQNSKTKQICLALFLNLLFNCSAILAIYLSFFANVSSFI